MTLVVHILKCAEPHLCLSFAVAVADKTHGHKAQDDKESGIGEKNLVIDAFHQRAGQNRGNDLCQHGGGIVIPGEFPYIAAPAHFHYHGQRIHIDGCPGQAYKGKGGIHNEID